MSKTFQYTILTTDYDPLHNPIINSDGSFTTLNKSTVVDGLNTIVSFEYIFVDNGTTNDGLYLYNAITTTTNMTIDDFADIPLSRSGSNFRDYVGNFPILSTNIPTLLSGADMSNMFYGATNFNQEIDGWDVSLVTNANNLFRDSAFNQNISSWDVSKITNMNRMFRNTPFNQNISGWTTTSLVNLQATFRETTAFNQDISGWNTSSVTTFNSMFYTATAFNQDVSSWNTASIINMNNMFRGATSFNQSLGSWDLSLVTIMTNMLNNTALSVANYSNTLIGWNNNINTPNSITFDASNLIYNSSGEIARDNLTTSKSWSITDSGLACMHETTNILCLIEEKEIYINIKDVKKGDDIITYKDGIKKVKSIHKVQTFNSKKKKITNFYVLPKEKCNILTNDLIITGGHSIILDKLEDDDLKYMESINSNNNHKLHDKYKLLASKHKDFICKIDESIEDVYMLLLENDDPLYTFGVYVNGGYLIETCGEQSFIKFGYPM